VYGGVSSPQKILHKGGIGDASKVCYFFAIPDEFKIKETVRKLKFLDSPDFASSFASQNITD